MFLLLTRCHTPRENTTMETPGRDHTDQRVCKLIELFKKDQVRQQENLVIAVLGETFEEVLGPNWWSEATRLTRNLEMSRTCYRVRYEMVARDRDLTTDKGRARLLFKHLLDCGLLSRVLCQTAGRQESVRAEHDKH